MLSRFAALLLSAAALSCASPAPVPFILPDAATDPAAALQAFVGAGGLPGISVGVIHGGKTVYTGVAGVRRLGDPTPVALGDAFHIGSDTKAMTALLAAMLVDEGKLQWDATVSQVLGSTVAARAEYGAVTVAQLLTHTSGIPDALAPTDWASFFAPNGRSVSEERRRMVGLALALAPASTPGSTFLYSNFNYVTVGLMLEVITGRTWEQLITARLFGPMHMSTAGFGPPASPGKVDAPWGHTPDPVAPGPQADNPAALGPAGTVHASTGDLLGYLQLYLSGGLTPDGTRLVSTASLARMETARLNQYGFGWGVLTDAQGQVALEHDGSNTTFYTSIFVIPAQGYALVVQTNRGDSEAGIRVGQVMQYLAGHFPL